MITGLWGKKIGMTQLFTQDNQLVPVTVIDLANWYITQIKTIEKDGYNAVQLGHLKPRYVGQEFAQEWLKNPRTYFIAFKEVHTNGTVEADQLGKPAQSSLFTTGETVDVFGITKGAGFQGVVKRHGFAGGRASHGAKFGRFTGSLSHMRSRGRVIKGKGMPGHMGVERQMMRNLEVIKVEPDAQVLLVKGSVPGKTGSLVFVRKHGE